jgi:hypothetical protein
MHSFEHITNICCFSLLILLKIKKAYVITVLFLRLYIPIPSVLVPASGALKCVVITDLILDAICETFTGLSMLLGNLFAAVGNSEFSIETASYACLLSECKFLLQLWRGDIV